MNLTHEHLVCIRQTVEESPISREVMRENIVDHLCCLVEQKMRLGESFHEAFKVAMNEFSPNGLKEIERETYLVLNFKIITMKKFFYFSAMTFSIFASIGLFLKTLKWVGANELLVLGFSGGAMLIPLLMVHLKNDKTELNRTWKWLGLISLEMVCIGGACKILHYASANEFLILGTALFSFGFLPTYFTRMYRQSITVNS